MRKIIKKFFIEEDGFRLILYELLFLCLLIYIIITPPNSLNISLITMILVIAFGVKLEHIEFLLNVKHKA